MAHKQRITSHHVRKENRKDDLNTPAIQEYLHFNWQTYLIAIMCTITHITNNVRHCFSESGIWKHDLEVFKEPVRDKRVPAQLQNITVQETGQYYMCETGNKTHLTCHERLTLTNTSTRYSSPNSGTVIKRCKQMTTSVMSKWESISILHHVHIFSFLTYTHTHTNTHTHTQEVKH